MQHIADFPLNIIHLYRQPQHPGVMLLQLKIIAFLDPYMKLAYCGTLGDVNSSVYTGAFYVYLATQW